MKTTPQESERSVTEPSTEMHPVKAFLTACGLDTQNFPLLSFIVEIPHSMPLPHRCFVPLRLPDQPSEVFETMMRVVRSVEIPAPAFQREDQKVNRKFYQIEWTFADQPKVDEETHQALPFIATELSCPACRESFLPEPDLLDDASVRIVCPLCFHHWTIRVESPPQHMRETELMLESYRKGPGQLRRLLQEWDRLPREQVETDARYHSYFPMVLESWKTSTALDWVFDDLTGFTYRSLTGRHDFESLCRSYLNLLTQKYFLYTRDWGRVATAEQTEIKQKTQVTQTLSVTDRLAVRSPTVIKEIPPLTVETVPSRHHWVYQVGFGALGLCSLGFIALLVTQNLPRARVAEFVPLTLQPQTLATVPELAPEPTTDMAATEVVKNAKDVIDENRNMAMAEPILQKPTPKLGPTKPSSDIDAYLRRGMFHLKLQQAKPAIAEFEKVLKIEPQNASSFRGLGLAYVYDHRFEEAIEAFEKYLMLTKGQASDRADVEDILSSLRERLSPVAKSNLP